MSLQSSIDDNKVKVRGMFGNPATRSAGSYNSTPRRPIVNIA
jgi:hypothetical protein